MFKTIEEMKNNIKNYKKEIKIKEFDIPLDSNNEKSNHWTLIKKMIFKWENKGRKSEALNTLNEIFKWTQSKNELRNPISIIQKPFWENDPKDIFDFKYKFINNLDTSKTPSTGEYYYIFILIFGK